MPGSHILNAVGTTAIASRPSSRADTLAWVSVRVAIHELQKRAETAELQSLSPDVLKLADLARSALQSAQLAPARFGVFQTLLAVAETIGIDDAADAGRRRVLQDTLAELDRLIADSSTEA